MENRDAFGATGGSPSTTGATGSLKNEVKNLASEARQGTARVAEQAKGQAAQVVDRQKAQAADRIGGVAGALRETSQKLEEDDHIRLLGRYAGTAADQADRLADYLRTKDVGTMVRDCETFARRHPDVFLGGAVVLGLLAARFLKSSASRPEAAESEPFNPPRFSDGLGTGTPVHEPAPGGGY
jgi:hypothetical protein